MIRSHMVRVLIHAFLRIIIIHSYSLFVYNSSLFEINKCHLAFKETISMATNKGTKHYLRLNNGWAELHGALELVYWSAWGVYDAHH